MISTAKQNLTAAHRGVFDLASRISDYLAEYEGTGLTLSFQQIAEGVGINLRSLSKTDGYLFYMSAEAAVDFRSWSLVSEPNTPARFQKKPAVTNYRKPAESPVAQARRKARAVAR